MTSRYRCPVGALVPGYLLSQSETLKLHRRALCHWHNLWKLNLNLWLIFTHDALNSVNKVLILTDETNARIQNPTFFIGLFVWVLFASGLIDNKATTDFNKVYLGTKEFVVK